MNQQVNCCIACLISEKVDKDERKRRKVEKRKGNRTRWRFDNAWRDPYGVLHLPPTSRNAFLRWQSKNRFEKADMLGRRHEPTIVSDPLPEFEWSDSPSEESCTSSQRESYREACRYAAEDQYDEFHGPEEESEESKEDSYEDASWTISSN